MRLWYKIVFKRHAIIMIYKTIIKIMSEIIKNKWVLKEYNYEIFFLGELIYYLFKNKNKIYFYILSYKIRKLKWKNKN